MPEAHPTIPKNARGVSSYDGTLALRKPKKDDGVVRFVGTTERLDGHGSVIRADGLEWDRFLANPVILLDHANSVNAIAGEAVEVRQITKPSRGFEIGVKFHAAGSPEVARAERLAKAGILRGMSMGFREKEVRFASELSEAEKVLWGIPPNGYLIKSAEVVEFSLVAVPSNQETLKRALAAGVLTEEDARDLAVVEGGAEQAPETNAAEPDDDPDDKEPKHPMEGCEELLRALVDGQRELGEVVEAAVAGMIQDSQERTAELMAGLLRLADEIRGGAEAGADRAARAKVAALADRIRKAVGANGRATAAT